jgi:hypothetical protein
VSKTLLTVKVAGQINYSFGENESNFCEDFQGLKLDGTNENKPLLKKPSAKDNQIKWGLKVISKVQPKGSFCAMTMKQL